MTIWQWYDSEYDNKSTVLKSSAPQICQTGIWKKSQNCKEGVCDEVCEGVCVFFKNCRYAMQYTFTTISLYDLWFLLTS